MLIGLISDTHIPDHAKELPDQLKEVFRGVDLILHAGDIYTPSVLDELQCLAPVLAAEGDDDPFVTANDSRVKKRHVLTVEGITIWLTHQKPLSQSLEYQEYCDVIVFGHSHEASLENHGDILRVNPGSPTFPHYKYELGTVGLLTVNSDKAEARIIQL